jgi:hypothetical protein
MTRTGNRTVLAKARRLVWAYRLWPLRAYVRPVRMVQYCGIEMIGAHDLVAHEVTSRIRGLTYEGFGVAWSKHNGRVYLVVWESWSPGDQQPDWDKVFAEQHLRPLPPLSKDPEDPTKDLARKAAQAQDQLLRDERFIASLGDEDTSKRCVHPGCTRGQIRVTTFCKAHHFEHIFHRRYPDDAGNVA